MSVLKQIGGVMLISGTSVGAGLLATPIDTASAGFIPSMFGLFICWLFMTISAFYALEVNLIFPKDNNFISMAYDTLGNTGKWITWGAYLLLLYTLICAYLSASNDWFLKILSNFDIEISKQSGFFIITALFAFLIGSGTSIVDKFNRLLAFGLIFIYSFLVAVTMPKVNLENLLPGNFSEIYPSMPLILTAFGFAIIIPSLTSYFHQDKNTLVRITLIGSIISLVIYSLWEFVVLGALPQTGEYSLAHISLSGGKGTDIANALEVITGNIWITTSSKALSIFVILTSFLGVALSLFDFLKDGLKLKDTLRDKTLLLVATFIPPLLISLTLLNQFIKILSLGGVFVATILGIIPAAMAYSSRYVLKKNYKFKVLGGKLLIFITTLFFLFVILQEIYNWL